MQELTKKQNEVFEFIKAYRREYGYSPTHQDIQNYLGISVGGVRSHLEGLRRKGYIRWRKKKARSIRIEGVTPDWFCLSLDEKDLKTLFEAGIDAKVLLELLGGYGKGDGEAASPFGTDKEGYCRSCDEVDHHTDDCPIPTIEAVLKRMADEPT